MKYFADTYALIEIIKGNPNYERYSKEELSTNLLNLYELYYALLKDYSEEIAKAYFWCFLSNIIDIGYALFKILILYFLKN